MRFQINWQDQHRHLDYREAYFKDSPQVKTWLAGGLNESQLQMGIHQMKEPYAWMSGVVEQAQDLGLEHCSFAFHRVSPGRFLPMHADTYDFFRAKFGITDIDRIQRTIVFIEDAADGHVLIVGDKCYMNWRAGDTATWSGATPHLAANLGTVDRYTLQITGVKNV